VVIDPDDGHIGRIVARISEDGGTKWATPLVGSVGGVRPPHVAVDLDRAYITHEGGVTALDVRTGRVLWRSPGPNERLLLSGDLLLAAECSCGDDVARHGWWLVARRTASGKEAFRVALRVKDFDPLPIKEAAGLFVVQALDSARGAGSSLLLRAVQNGGAGRPNLVALGW
jgi:hypothetical protein